MTDDGFETVAPPDGLGVPGVPHAPAALVVTDLDGTLWGADERVHRRTRAALHTLERRGVPVLAATGRRWHSAVDTLAGAGLRLPAVVLDGALGRDLDGDRTFHRRTFTPRAAAAVLEAFRSHGLSPCVYVDRPDAEVVTDHAPSTHPRHQRYLGRWCARTADLAAVAATEPVLMFAVCGAPAAVLEPVAAAAAVHAAPALTRDVVYGGMALTVRPAGISKWDGVLAWCRDQGLDPGRVLAVGDGQNDLELLQAAQVACVVEDGCDEALAVAQHVIGPAHTGGWSAILDLL